MDLAKMDIFLGYDWLNKHNPNIDWREHTISFTWCLSPCGKEHAVRTIDFQTTTWEAPEWFRAFTTKSTLLAQEANAQKKEKMFEEMVPQTYHEFKDVFELTLFNELPPKGNLGTMPSISNQMLPIPYDANSIHSPLPKDRSSTNSSMKICELAGFVHRNPLMPLPFFLLPKRMPLNSDVTNRINVRWCWNKRVPRCGQSRRVVHLRGRG